jgi:hypothetical protein
MARDCRRRAANANKGCSWRADACAAIYYGEVGVDGKKLSGLAAMAGYATSTSRGSHAAPFRNSSEGGEIGGGGGRLPLAHVSARRPLTQALVILTALWPQGACGVEKHACSTVGNGRNERPVSLLAQVRDK